MIEGSAMVRHGRKGRQPGSGTPPSMAVRLPRDAGLDRQQAAQGELMAPGQDGAPEVRRLPRCPAPRRGSRRASLGPSCSPESGVARPRASWWRCHDAAPAQPARRGGGEPAGGCRERRIPRPPTGSGNGRQADGSARFGVRFPRARVRGCHLVPAARTRPGSRRSLRSVALSDEAPAVAWPPPPSSEFATRPAPPSSCAPPGTRRESAPRQPQATGGPSTSLLPRTRPSGTVTAHRGPAGGSARHCWLTNARFASHPHAAILMRAVWRSSGSARHQPCATEGSSTNLLPRTRPLMPQSQIVGLSAWLPPHRAAIRHGPPALASACALPSARRDRRASSRRRPRSRPTARCRATDARDRDRRSWAVGVAAADLLHLRRETGAPRMAALGPPVARPPPTAAGTPG
jgi:hypothetical protein